MIALGLTVAALALSPPTAAAHATAACADVTYSPHIAAQHVRTSGPETCRAAVKEAGRGRRIEFEFTQG